MPKGGVRIGAGRPRGAQTRITLEIVAGASKKGRAPLERLLGYRDFWDSEAEKIKPSLREDFAKLLENNFDLERLKIIREKVAIIDKAFSANLAAAPYCHARQGALAVFEPVSGKMEHTAQYLESLRQTTVGPKKKETPDE